MPRANKKKKEFLCLCGLCVAQRAAYGNDLVYCVDCNVPRAKADGCEHCNTCDNCRNRHHPRCVVCEMRFCNEPAAGLYCIICHSCTEHCVCEKCTRCDKKFLIGNLGSCAPCRICAVCNFGRPCGCGPVQPGRPVNPKVQFEQIKLAQREFKVRTSKADELLKDGNIINKARIAFHTSKKTEFKQNPLKRYIAVELEIAGLQPGPLEGFWANPLNLDVETMAINEVVEKWRANLVKDISLPFNGFEINTAPANGDLFVRQVTEIHQVLSKFGATCRNTYDERKRVQPCGMHVHADARDFSYIDMRRFLLLYELLEPALYRMLPPYRKHSHYAIPCGTHYGIRVRANKPIKPKDREKLHQDPSKVSLILGAYDTAVPARGDKRDCPLETRYRAVNLHAYWYRGTIEFRHYFGTMKLHEILNWATLVGTIVDFAYRVPNSTIERMTKEMDSEMALREVAASGSGKLVEFVAGQLAVYSHLPEGAESPVLGQIARVGLGDEPRAAWRNQNGLPRPARVRNARLE